MKFRLLDWIVCPLCGTALECKATKSGPARAVQEASSPSVCGVCRGPHPACAAPCQDCYGLEVEDGELVCGQGHRFPLVAGVPILTPGAEAKSAESESIAASFGREWAHFD
jgi:uncharacterized protein YbaR (Trm112 family)